MRVAQCFSMLILLACGLFFMPHAKASCTTPSIPFTANMASVAVSSTLDVGAVIPGTEQTVEVHGSCSEGHEGNVIIACYYGTGAEVAGYPGVYDTGVEGIGITLVNQQGQRIIGGGAWCDTRNTPLGYVSSDGNDTFNFTATLALVKTSTHIGTGSLLQAQTQFGVGVYGREGLGSPNTISYSGNIAYKVVTCSVDPKSLTITLGDFPESQFTAPGVTTAWHPFSVNVLCNDPVEIGVKVSSANGYEASLPGVMKLTQEAGAATGLGVRMQTNGQPTVFDAYVLVGGIARADTSLAIPFQVQYYQVANSVTPGSANTVATITVSYR